MTKDKFFLMAWTDWWVWALGSIPATIGLYTSLRKVYNSALAKALKQNRDLRQNNTRLELEGKIRLDDLADYKAQIDVLQVKVIEQQRRAREHAQELIELSDRQAE